MSFTKVEGILVKYLFYDEYKETDLTFESITEKDFDSKDFISL